MKLAHARQGLAATNSTMAASGKPPVLHSRSEASRLVLDAGLHAWLMRRQKRTDVPKARTYMTRHRRAMLQQAFQSIDRDGSGAIDRHELCWQGSLGCRWMWRSPSWMKAISMATACYRSMSSFRSCRSLTRERSSRSFSMPAKADGGRKERRRRRRPPQRQCRRWQR